ncbi:MAG: anti-sigma factor [Bryobacteraceae bacterium]
MSESSRTLTCAELAEWFEFYALGVLDPAIQAQVDTHLTEACKTCAANLAKATALNSILLSMVPNAAMPSRLKHRLLAAVGHERPRWGWAGAMATMLMLIVALWLGYEERQRGKELADARQVLMRVASERDQFSQALAFLSDPATKSASFGGGTQPGGTRPIGKQARGQVFLHSEFGVLLVASNLPALAKGKAYEMWLIPRAAGAAPRSAGLFDSNGTRALYIVNGPLDVADIAAVTVTVETEKGSQSPTSPVLFTARLN